MLQNIPNISYMYSNISLPEITSKYLSEIMLKLKKTNELKDELVDIALAIQLKPELKSKIEPLLTDILDLAKNENIKNFSREIAIFILYCYEHSDVKKIIIDILINFDNFHFPKIFDYLKIYRDFKTIPYLLKLEKNTIQCETLGMGGPKRYEYRDTAFDTIEYIANQNFIRLDNCTVINNEEIRYYDWTPIHKWWQIIERKTNNKKTFFSWLKC